MKYVDEPLAGGIASYQISDDGNIDMVGYRAPSSRRLRHDLKQLEKRCKEAAQQINSKSDFKAHVDTDLCLVVIEIEGYEGINFDLNPVERIEETIIDSYWVPAWEVLIDDDRSTPMSLGAALAYLHRWDKGRILDEECRAIEDRLN